MRSSDDKPCLARFGLVVRRDRHPDYAHQFVAAKQQRQAFALPRWDMMFLQQVLQAAPRRCRVRTQGFAAAAQAQGNLSLLQFGQTDTLPLSLA